MVIAKIWVVFGLFELQCELCVMALLSIVLHAVSEFSGFTCGNKLNTKNKILVLAIAIV